MVLRRRAFAYFAALATVAAGFRLEISAPAATAEPPAPPGTAAAEAQAERPRLDRIGPVVEAAIAGHKLPGAVVLVGRAGPDDGRPGSGSGDAILYRQAFGSRAVEPATEPMTAGTIFDLASLTKVVATTTAVMQLVERGEIRLADPVAAYVPEFGKYGKEKIEVRHLLAHVSGLRPDLDVEGTDWTGGETAIRLAGEETLEAPPGTRLIYSDINFELLGEIVRRVGGRPLDVFARDEIFGPLGMRDTTFTPPPAWRARIAPTERVDGTWLRGIVHDPTARRMGGVAGHAGLFSTADDLARFCRMLLHGGTLDGARILSPLTVRLMTSRATPPFIDAVRGLGWDLGSSFSANRGDLFPPGSFGHTGFTGTSLWIDPATRTYVIFLSNRVHPDGKGDVTPLRARVASIAAAAIDGPVPPRSAARPDAVDFGPATGAAPPAAAPREPVLAGIDVLETEGFAPLAGRRVGLITNRAGVDRAGASTIDLLSRAPGVTLVALFAPEHGIRAQLDEGVPDTRDEATGLPVYSLYGRTTRPTSEMLQGIDTLVVDLPDVGARFYTYKTTMAYAMEEAAKRKLKVIVLDRPNPIDGVDIEGPGVDAAMLRAGGSFTSYFSMPIRHGMTIGELARLFNTENRIGADLRVVPMRHWQRGDWFDATGLAWANPSPNIRNLYEAALYPGIGAIEGTNISVGRGTDTPFEQIGAPWIDGAALAGALDARQIPGVRFYPVRFTPAAREFAGQPCGGVFIVVTDRSALRPVELGLEIAAALWRLYGGQFKIEQAMTLLGSADTIARLRAGENPREIAASWKKDEAAWRLLRAKYLLY